MNTKEYTNGEITIVWKPDLCTHSCICVNTLPKVYKPSERPWIQKEGWLLPTLLLLTSKVSQSTYKQ